MKNSVNTQYDIIIAGAGASGLTLAYMLNQRTPHKKVLIIEKEDKSRNDRTWCFWTKSKTAFDEIVYKKWDKIRFINKRQEETFDIDPYQYQMIRGIDFYNFTHKSLKHSKNIKFVKDVVMKYKESGDSVMVSTTSTTYAGQLFFNSIPPSPPDYISKRNNFLLQHFKGYVVKTSQTSFDPNTPYFMDFSVDQKGQTRFGYVLPFSESEALIEFTIFSESLFEDHEYTALLKDYISNNLGIGRFEVLEEEFGVIPMTDIPFQRNEGNRIINIGYRSGMTKGSSGYTFLNIQKECECIVDQLAADKPVKPQPRSKKFRFFDSVLLQVLARELLPADQVFSNLFFKNKTVLIFKFLDETTSISEDLKILSSLPTLPFLKGAYFTLFSSGTKKILFKAHKQKKVKS